MSNELDRLVLISAGRSRLDAPHFPPFRGLTSGANHMSDQDQDGNCRKENPESNDAKPWAPDALRFVDRLRGIRL